MPCDRALTGTRPRLDPLLAQYDWAVERLLQGRALTQGDHPACASAAEGVAALRQGAEAWREALTSADDAELDRIGRSRYPDDSDADEAFIHVVWWVNQEVLHHGAEIALLRDLYRAGRHGPGTPPMLEEQSPRDGPMS